MPHVSRCHVLDVSSLGVQTALRGDFQLQTAQVLKTSVKEDFNAKMLGKPQVRTGFGTSILSL